MLRYFIHFFIFLIIGGGNFKIAAKGCDDLGEALERRKTVERGQTVVSHNTLLRMRIKFQEQARKKNPALRILDIKTLDELKRETLTVGIVGFSGGKEFNERASRIAIVNFLRTLDPTRTLLVTGATNEGVPALIYEIGHKMGFKTIGITSLQSGRYEPARMDYLMVEGDRFGRESDFFITNSDIIVGFGGGKQSEAEITSARALGKPVILVANSDIQGASAKVPGRKYTKGEEAGRAVKKNFDNIEFFKWVRKLPKDVFYISPEDLPEIFPDNRLVGFTGWSLNGPKKNRDLETAKFVRDVLSKMKPDRDIVVTGGSHIGAERIVHEIAKEMGFKQIDLVSHEIAQPGVPLNPYVYAIVPVARTWLGRQHGFINRIDALVSLGGGEAVSNQITLGLERGIPVVHMIGNFSSTDARIQNSNVKFRSGNRAAQQISKNF